LSHYQLIKHFAQDIVMDTHEKAQNIDFQYVAIFRIVFRTAANKPAQPFDAQKRTLAFPATVTVINKFFFKRRKQRT
jgi:hypothetical protein